MELPEANKSSPADEPENKETNWMQIREIAAAGPLFKAASRALSTILFRALSGAVF
jgi:hypothetical protein